MEAYSKDDWDGDGVMNNDEANEAAKFNLDSDGNGTMDGFPLPADPEDTDRDGLDNQFEQIIGTDENDLDTDNDLYPDGFEVANNLDPLHGDSVEIKFIPLGFYPDLNEEIFLYSEN